MGHILPWHSLAITVVEPCQASPVRWCLCAPLGGGWYQNPSSCLPRWQVYWICPKRSSSFPSPYLLYSAPLFTSKYCSLIGGNPAEVTAHLLCSPSAILPPTHISRLPSLCHPQHPTHSSAQIAKPGPLAVCLVSLKPCLSTRAHAHSCECP